MQITAAVTREANTPFSIERVELDAPKANELLVEIKAVGICHTDIAAMQQHLPIPLPAVLGHEGAGIVAQVGSGVTQFSVGDHVALSFASCNHCSPCIEGRPYACHNMFAVNFAGTMPDGTQRLHTDGEALSSFFGQSSFATHAVVQESSAVKIDDDIPFSVAAPLGCGVQTGAGIVLNQLRADYSSRIAIIGCGTVGMSAIMAARLAGCSTIVAVGGRLQSLELARELGATHTINRNDTNDLTTSLREISPEGFDFAIETSGVEGMIKSALAALHFTGKMVTAGAGTITLHTGLELGARSIMGVTEGNSLPQVFIPRLLRLYKQGWFPVDKLIKTFSFDHIEEAFEASNNGSAIKAVLTL